jgi:DNA-binding Xre family transcriptional regulator
VTKKMGIRWQLRLRMAEKGLFQTSDLVPLLAERGIHLSREQVYRLVTQVPQRLSTDTLAALCDILDCQLLAAYLSAHRTMSNGSALCAALAVTERD